MHAVLLIIDVNLLKKKNICKYLIRTLRADMSFCGWRIISSSKNRRLAKSNSDVSDSSSNAEHQILNPNKIDDEEKTNKMDNQFNKYSSTSVTKNESKEQQDQESNGKASSGGNGEFYVSE